MSTLINQEALDDPIYNPPADASAKKALMLMQVMEKTRKRRQKTPPTKNVFKYAPPGFIIPTELQEHVATILSMSPYNPAQGVLVNPAQCLIDDVREILTQPTIGGPVADKWDPTSPPSPYDPPEYDTPIVPNPSYIPNVIAEILTLAPEAEYAQEWQSIGFEDDSEEIAEDLEIIEDHTDRLTSNLPSLAGIAQGSLALATLMNLLSNPCLGLSGFLGSIMDEGKRLLNEVKSQVTAMLDQAKEVLNNLKDAIEQGVQDLIAEAKSVIKSMMRDIKDAFNVAKDMVKDFINNAMAEVMNFAKALLDQIRQGLSELLANLPKDPCLRSLLGSVVTGAAAAIIG